MSKKEYWKRSIDDFISSLIGKSAATRKTYRSVLSQFFNFVNKNPEDVTPLDVRKFLSYAEEKLEWKVASLKLASIVIHRFFEFLGKGKDFIEISREIPQPKTKYGRFLTPEEVRSLLNAIDNFSDYLKVRLVLVTGMRIGELADLKIEDIDFKNEQIIVRGKGGKEKKERIVDIDSNTLSMLKKYIGNRKSGWVWIERNDNNRDTFLRNLQRKIRKYARKAGISKRVTMHWLRHTFAVNFLRSGGDVEALRRLLGHSKLSTTQIYLDYTRKVIKEQYRRAMNEFLPIIDSGGE